MHDLWIFPAPRASRWFARIDWYLNWQMSRGISYSGLNLPVEISRVADRHGVEMPATTAKPSDLMVLPGSLVPARKCLVMDQSSSTLAEWFERIFARAATLGARSARVFLPTGVTLTEAENMAREFDLAWTLEPDLEAAR